MLSTVILREYGQLENFKSCASIFLNNIPVRNDKIKNCEAHSQFFYGLGENTDDPGSKLTTKTKVADGFRCIVSCSDAAFFRVPAAKAVSNGMLLFIRMLVRKLNSYREICSLLKTFLKMVPESKKDICVSNMAYFPFLCIS